MKVATGQGQENTMSQTISRDVRGLRGLDARDTADHRVKMFKELARLAPLETPEEPEEYRLRARAHRLETSARER